MKVKIILMAAVFGLCYALVGAGCSEEDDGPDPIVGDWKLAEEVCGEYGEMEIEEDLEGEATIYFVYLGDCWYADFDFEIEKDGGDYVFDMECDGDCSDLDFEMECELDGDELECDGDEMWSDFPFDWELD